MYKTKTFVKRQAEAVMDQNKNITKDKGHVSESNDDDEQDTMDGMSE